jgi:hypothetical protein
MAGGHAAGLLSRVLSSYAAGRCPCPWGAGERRSAETRWGAPPPFFAPCCLFLAFWGYSIPFPLLRFPFPFWPHRKIYKSRFRFILPVKLPLLPFVGVWLVWLGSLACSRVADAVRACMRLCAKRLRVGCSLFGCLRFCGFPFRRLLALVALRLIGPPFPASAFALVASMASCAGSLLLASSFRWLTVRGPSPFPGFSPLAPLGWIVSPRA